MIEITMEEYLERLKILLPGFNVVRKLEKGAVVPYQFSFETHTVEAACKMINELSENCYDQFKDLPETDLVSDMKECFTNLNVLGMFLAFIFERVMNGD